MDYRDLPRNQASVLTLFRELSHSFFDINLRMFRLGMLGEVHGQNAVMVWKSGQAQGLLLRDHDSLRIFVPWLERNGMHDPEYRIKKGHANTLYHDRPEDLLFWLQTLGIQVNVRAIMDTLAQVYQMPVTALWTVLRDVLDNLITTIEFDDEARAMIRHQLFDAPNWPQKLLLTPMIERAGARSTGCAVTPDRTLQPSRRTVLRLSLGLLALPGIVRAASLRSDPLRVVTLFQGASDSAVALGVTPCGVVDSWSEPMYRYLRPALAAVPHVGLETQPSLEDIVLLKPDLIVASRFRHQRIAPLLEQICPVLVLEEVFEFKRTLAMMGAAMNRQQQAMQLLGEWQRRVTELRGQLQAKFAGRHPRGPYPQLSACQLCRLGAQRTGLCLDTRCPRSNRRFP